MASQNTIKLKRSSTQSNVPSLGDLTLGELAVNTFDGKLFIKKDDGSEAIETIVTTHAQITGSIELTSAVTSSFQLIHSTDGSSLDMLTIRVGDEDRVTVNSDGTFIIKEVDSLPTGETGGLAVSGSNFFIYL